MHGTRVVLAGLIVLAAAPLVYSAVSEHDDLTAGGRLEVSLRAMNSPILVAEPLHLEMKWRNVSEQSVSLKPSVSVPFSIRTGDGPARRVWFRNGGPIAYVSMPSVTLAKGESFAQSWWVVMGDEGVGQPRLIFDAPGVYRVWPTSLQPEVGAVVDVCEPATETDRGASRLWGLEIARAFVGGRLTDDGGERLDKILEKYPESRFAPYAAWIKVMDLKGGSWGGYSPDVDYSSVSNWLEFILAKHPTWPMREQVLVEAFNAYRFQKQWDRAKRVAEQLVREFPSNPELPHWYRYYGANFERLGPPVPPKEPAVPKTDVAAALEMEGMTAVPEGPRQTFETFFRAVAREDRSVVKEALADDFMADAGPAETYGGPASGSWHRYNTKRIRVVVKRVEMTKTYTRPSSLPMGPERTWGGNNLRDRSDHVG